MARPFEIPFAELPARIDEMVDATFGDLQSQFLLMPKGAGYVEFADFQDAFEVLKRCTASFNACTEENVWLALEQDALCLVVLRCIIGLSPPEFAELARDEMGSDLTQSAARTLDARVRRERSLFSRANRAKGTLGRARVGHLVSVALKHISQGAPPVGPDALHRLGKVDTAAGLPSLRHVASHHVPYAVLLYERYLGRPFASHRDAVSELVGDVTESAIEEQLSRHNVTFRKTRRAERLEGFAQAPDFFVPTEFSPSVIIEAKITNDDGTARDKVARILRLASMRDQRQREGLRTFEVVACLDGRGFGVRRQDMRDALVATHGKVFTLATLEHLVQHTLLRSFAS